MPCTWCRARKRIPDQTHDQEGVDVDNDDTQEQIQPAYLEPIDAFNQALLAFGVRWKEADQAVADAYAKRFVASATDAVALWIAADAALKRLAHAWAEAPALLHVARLGLTERYDALIGLFDLARERIADPGHVDRLASARRSLEIAHR
jgi:hypothetical protein